MQSDLFGPAPALPAKQGPIATVALIAPVDKHYSYYIPDDLAEQVVPGVRLHVRIGPKGRKTTAFCLAVHHGQWTTKLRPVDAVLDDQPLFSPELLALGQWIGRYYCCSAGLALDALVPAAIKDDVGLVKRRYAQLPDTPPEPVGRPPSPKQQRVVEILQAARQPIALDAIRQQAGCTDAPIRSAAARGLIELIERHEHAQTPLPGQDEPIVEPDFKLTLDQQRAIDRVVECVENAHFRAILLHGVTGSGKTEVYVHAIRAAIAAGKQAIMLVPEIALTTQTVTRLTRRFHNVALLHSGLTDRQRASTWRQIAAGKVDVVIGTRSALFAPCKALGLIVVDEEQESSFKNLQSPRYNTRDVALKRAQLESVPVVMGSATPSMETWLNTQRADHYECIKLPSRVRNLPLPTVTMVDLRAESHARPGIHLLSRELEAAIGETLTASQQIILLLNRRGYANYLFCPSCKNVISCPQCKVNMTFHKTSGQAHCHQCSARFIVPEHCPHCRQPHKLVRFGMGTQRVEEELARKFPPARVARVDSDTMTKYEHYQQIIGDFEAGKLDIIIGTQMIAKGLDFPFVSLVGVVNADTALAIPDFRSGERTFQLVTQVAGRAGRADTPGRVVVQTFSHDQPALQMAITHDFERFAQQELQQRQALMLPPYGRMTRITLADARRSRCREQTDLMAQQIRQTIETLGSPVQCTGPQPAPIERLRNRYRFDVLLMAPSAKTMQHLLAVLRDERALSPRTKSIVIDVDPVAVL